MIQLKDAFVLIPTAVGFSRSTFYLDDKNAHIDPDRLTRCVMCVFVCAGLGNNSQRSL